MISPETYLFLADLRLNNHRNWFEENRDRYEAARQDFLAFVQELIHQIAEFDPAVATLEAKDCMFRIYRDTRFSRNKEPYKPNFAAVISPGGRKSPLAGYYLHLQPGETFLGGGSYLPPAPQLKQIRAHIDQQAAKLREITSAKEFQETFGELRGESLKTAPRDYPKDHPDIDLLRKKGFWVSHPVADEQVDQPDFAAYCARVYQTMQPLNAYLNEALNDDA